LAGFLEEKNMTRLEYFGGFFRRKKYDTPRIFWRFYEFVKNSFYEFVKNRFCEFVKTRFLFKKTNGYQFL